ncbi:serine hydrolase domain-containing protein [Ekhidna sp.]
MKKLFSSILMIASLLVNGQLNHSQITEIDSYLEELVNDKAPGIAAGIIKNGDVVYENYLGLSNLEHQVKVNLKSTFNIASVAKQFTALSILKLSLDEKLDLEDDTREYISQLYPDVEEIIRIRHLLNHTSGIRDFYDLLSIQQKPWWREEGLDNQAVIEMLTKQEDLGFNPGSTYLYSNSNYTILAKIVEVASGQPFHEYTKQLFEELGMNQTFFLKDYMNVIPHKASPYADWGDGVWKEYPMMTNLYGDGFLFTTLQDQLTYEKAMQNATTKNELLYLSQQSITNAEIVTYGFGLELEDRIGRKAVHHSGSTGAYHSQIVRYIDDETSIVIMSNNGKLWSGAIADKISEIILPKLEDEKKEFAINTEAFTRNLPTNEITGEYLSPKGNVIRITKDAESLYWQLDNNNPIPLEFKQGSLYLWNANESVKIGFSESAFTILQQDKEPRIYKKLDSFIPSKNYIHSLTGTYYNEELDLTFDLSKDKDFNIIISDKQTGQSGALQIIQKDRFMFSDYKFRTTYDEVNKVSTLLMSFSRAKNIRFRKTDSKLSDQLKYTEDGGYIQVSTISSEREKDQILLTKNYSNDNEEWSQIFGGKSYDRVSSIELTQDGGYLIVGSTSSDGEGNYDVLIIKTDKQGKKVWSETFGQELNDYGLSAQLLANNQIKVKGTRQKCESKDFSDCTDEKWIFTTQLDSN